MKKSLRILSLILVVAMLAGTMSVAASAGQEFKGNDATVKSSLTFDDVNTAIYSTEQYATMALDEVDRMLNEAQIGSIDIFVGTLTIADIDGTLDGVNTLLGDVSSLLTSGVLGDAGLLEAPLTTFAAKGRTDISDTQLLYNALDLISSLKQVLYKYVAGTIDVGILQGLISDYIFDVRELVFGLLCGATGLGLTEEQAEDYDYFDMKASERWIPSKYEGTGTAMVFVQDLINNLVLGEWTKLDDKFYNATTNKSSNVLYSEYLFYDGEVTGDVNDCINNNDATGANYQALDTANYDYYGWVHEDEWVTFGLGDAVRVAKDATTYIDVDGETVDVTTPSYCKVDMINASTTYDFIEGLAQQAYNGVAVPAIQRLVVQWLKEEQGYTFESLYTEKYKKDVMIEATKDGEEATHYYPESEWYVTNETTGEIEDAINPNYDYCYAGIAPETISGDAIYQIFDLDNLTIPRASVPDGKTFVQELNNNAFEFAKAVLDAKCTQSTTNENIYTFSWNNGKESTDAEYKSCEFTWTKGDNDDNLLNNICNLVKFVLVVTGDDFFGQEMINRGEVLSQSEIMGLSNMQVLAYIVRAILNSSFDFAYIPDDADHDSLAEVLYEFCRQWAYQDIALVQYPDITQNEGETDDAYYDRLINATLDVLINIASYALNQSVDANVDQAASGNKITNDGTKNSSGVYNNNTGLLPYVSVSDGSSVNYGSVVGMLAKWGFTRWASTKTYATNTSSTTPGTQSSTYECLIAQDFASDDSGTVTEATFWSDLDLLLNSIIPIDADNTSTSTPDNRPWINDDIASSASPSKTFLLDYILKPIVKANFNNIYDILERNDNGAFAHDTFETVLVDTLHRIFDDLFPDVFTHTATTIDEILDNDLLANMVYDLAVTLGATSSEKGKTNGNTINGRGKVIVGVALPIVCLVLGLNDPQEFDQLENYLSDVSKLNGSNVTFMIYNGSSGVNTSYVDPTTKSRSTDNLYEYSISNVQCNVIEDGEVTGTHQVTGFTAGDTLAGGETKTLTIQGANNGEMLEVITTYTVSDEEGNAMGGELQNTTYTYVSSQSYGDDEIAQYKVINGVTFKYYNNIYLDTGSEIDDIDSQNIRFEDEDITAGMTVSVESISTTGSVTGWATKNTAEDQTSITTENKGGTQILYPYKGDSDHFKRTVWEYSKTDGKYDTDDWGMKVRTGNKETPDGYTLNSTTGVYSNGKTGDDARYFSYLDNGEYTITTTIKVGDKTGTITQKVHLYDDYGLKGLVEDCIEANRSSKTVTDTTAWENYYVALCAAAEFALPPKANGSDFTDHIGVTNLGQYNETNKYLTLYRALYQTIEPAKTSEAESGADVTAIFNAINAVEPYNWTRGSYTAAGQENSSVTAYYREWKEYYESGYNFDESRNYMVHTWDTFEDAVDYANGLVERQWKYAAYNAEDYAALSDTEKTALGEYYDLYNDQTKTAVTSVEQAYAIHMVELTYERLLKLPDAATSTTYLQSVYDTFVPKADSSSYSTGSWADYSNAKTFAYNVLNGVVTTSPESVTKATTKLIEAWKALAPGASYTTLATTYNTETTAITKDAVWGVDNTITAFSVGSTTISYGINVADAAEQSKYTEESYTAYLTALKTGYDLLKDYADGNGLAENDQDIIDAAVTAINTAKEALEEATIAVEPVYEIDTENLINDTWTARIATTSKTIFKTDITDITVTGYNSGDPIDIDGVIYGIPIQASASDYNALFNVENCTVKVVKNKDSKLGTGTTILILDNDNNVVACYIAAIRGDGSGDGKVNTSDIAAAKSYMVDNTLYDYGEKICYYKAGLDTNDDKKINTTDITNIKLISGNTVEWNQNTGKEVL